MQRCIQLAQNGLGTTYTNPMVGSVIVHNDKIIGEGWHRKAGEPHAEVHAIQSVQQPELLPEATIYVSLEPCSHYGKTPPCSDLIIQKGIKKVVIGAIDSFAKVSGRGIQKLKDAGCDVTVGILEKECLALNKRFFTFHNKKRPYIILKWAQSFDGFTAPKTQDIKDRKPVWITTVNSRQLVHKWRAEEHAILVGTSTAVKDNPKLDVRNWTGNSPIRIVLDPNERIPKSSHIFDQSVKTIIVTQKGLYQNLSLPEVVIETLDFSGSIATQLCALLHIHEIQSVIIEGGSQTLQTFIDENLWDEARVFTGKSHFKEGILAPKFFRKKPSLQTTIHTDTLTYYHND